MRVREGSPTLSDVKTKDYTKEVILTLLNSPSSRQSRQSSKKLHSLTGLSAHSRVV